jgi:hypothetical protein
MGYGAAQSKTASVECMRVYEMLQLEVRPDPEGYEISGAFYSKRPKGRRRFNSTKPTELRFRALLGEGDARVVFHRDFTGPPPKL